MPGEWQLGWKNSQRIDSLKLTKFGKNHEPTNQGNWVNTSKGKSKEMHAKLYYNLTYEY